MAVLEEDVALEGSVTLATKLRQAREEAGLTRAKVAEMSNGVLSAKAIEKYETGVEPPVSKLKLLAEIYDLSPAEIFGEVDSPPPKGRVVRKSATAADGNADLVRALSLVLAKHGVKVRFSPSGSQIEEIPEPENDVPAVDMLPGQAAIDGIAQLVAGKGVTAKALRAQVSAAVDVLSPLDGDEISALADHFGYSLDPFPELSNADLLSELSVQDQDVLTDQAAALLIVQAVYPDFLMLSDEGFEAVRDTVNGALAKDDFLASETVPSMGLLDHLLGGDDTRAAYKARLLRELPPALIECIAQRKPVDLADDARYPRVVQPKKRGAR